MSNISTAFNDHFMEFVNEIHKIFPNDPDILTSKTGFSIIRKTNPKMIVKIWKTFITDKYENEINLGNVDFFINKNYEDDLARINNQDQILQAINKLRNPIKNMTDEDKEKMMKYIQNLTKLSLLISKSTN